MSNNVVAAQKETQQTKTPHITLLGDSIFDNAVYVGKGEEVLSKLRAQMPSGWSASLGARDGAVIQSVYSQLDHLPADTTHLVISVGGNDALGNMYLLRGGASSVADAVAKVADVKDGFSNRYRAMLDAVAKQGKPTAVCTIYEGNLPDPMEQRLAATALSILNDVITREAAARRLPIIDLRVIFNEKADYANAIEPSGHGGEKMARRIVAIVEHHDFSGPSSIYV